jgi:subtilisin-like proprotein convertase family protein
MVRFRPTAASEQRGMLDITSNDPDEEIFTIFLLGGSRCSTDVPKDIPGRGTITSTLFIDGDLNINDVNVRLFIAHSSVSDLNVTLTSPQGTTVELFTNVGGRGNNFGSTCAPLPDCIFDDQASTSITRGRAPFVGRFQSEGRTLGMFNGENAMGAWTLTVTDSDFLNNGTLNCWCLDISAAVPDVQVTPTNLGFGGVPVGQSAQQTTTVRNLGNALLRVDLITTDNPQFQVVAPSVPFTVLPGGQQPVTVRFTPTEVGPQMDTLRIFSNDPDEDPVIVSLTGGIGGLHKQASNNFRAEAQSIDSDVIVQRSINPAEDEVIATVLEPGFQEVELNDSLAEANLITPDAAVIGALDPAGDEDFFGFDAQAGQTLLIAIEVQSLIPPSLANIVVTLFDANGNQLAENDDANAQTRDSFLQFVIPASGRYYFRVKNFNPGDGGPEYLYHARVRLE